MKLEKFLRQVRPLRKGDRIEITFLPKVYTPERATRQTEICYFNGTFPREVVEGYDLNYCSSKLTNRYGRNLTGGRDIPSSYILSIRELSVKSKK